MLLRDVLFDAEVLEWSGAGAGDRVAPREGDRTDPHSAGPTAPQMVDVTSMTHDSRRVRPGGLFCAVPGTATDGHDHADEAVGAGAVALLVEKPLSLPVPQARVARVRDVMGPAASRLNGEPSRSMRVLGVTGTNGKTTVAYLLEAIAGAEGGPVGVVGTLGMRIGDTPLGGVRTTPEAPELQEAFATMRDRGVRTVAVEVSSHAMSQGRVDGTWFTAVCFTNLSHDHLDYHRTLDAYFEAKARLFTPSFTTVGAVNLDDRHGGELVGRARAAGLSVHTFALDDPGAEVRAEAVELQVDGSRFALVDDVTGERGEVALGLVGRFNVSNAVAAATTALRCGVPFPTVVSGLAALVAVPGRMERVDAGQPFTVFVDYAHTPDGLARVLGAARRIAADRKVLVVFGCGGDRDRDKRHLMGAVASERAEVVVVTSDNPRSEDPAAIAAEILSGAAPGTARPEVELDRRRAIAEVLGRARPGDVVVVAGKGSEQGQEASGVTVPFDDRVVVREEWEARAWS